MDAETENLVHNSDDVEMLDVSDHDDGLDKLLHKTVTVSQVNLPLATIDRDIDDIASACCEDPAIRSTVGIDDDVLKLIERTRQRRELLNQKMGKTPEAAPRKRRTPLLEDLSDNVNKQSTSGQPSEDSPKRQCVREDENQIKPDTPAIPSVRSRLHNLASQRCEWSDVPDADSKGSPVPTPRKSLSSPPEEKPKARQQENMTPGSSRKSRFAQLAQCINNWEDDLSHPTITKEEEKKPRWQPPKAKVQEPAPSKKGPAPPPPTTSSSLASRPLASPKKTPAPEAAAKSAEKTPVRTGSKVGLNSSPKPFKPYEEKNVRVSPVKSPVCSKSNLAAARDEEKGNQAPPRPAAPPTDRMDRGGLQTPKSAAKPADRPISARLANWEQKISESASKPDVPSTPKSGFTASVPVRQTPKETCTPARPLNTPAGTLHTPARPLSTPARDGEDVQVRPKVRKSVDDEPTAHSVSARMSAWEVMSSANVVSDIKKVRPGDCTPIKTPAKPNPSSAVKPPAGTTPGKAGTKSFQDSIKERASQVNPGSSTASGSPGKSLKVSPTKASPAMKSVQQRLIEQTQSMDMAQRLRQERMAELQAIQNRWKNGILRDDDQVPEEEPPKPESTAKTSKKEVIREKAREAPEPAELNPPVDKVKLAETGLPVDKVNWNETISPGDEVKANESVPPASEEFRTETVPGEDRVNPSETERVEEKETMDTETVPDTHDYNDDDKGRDGRDKMAGDLGRDGTDETTADICRDGRDEAAAVEVDTTTCEAQRAESGDTDSKVDQREEGQQDSKLGDKVGNEHTRNVHSEPVVTDARHPNSQEDQSTCENFENKLAAMGFDVSSEGKASYPFRDRQKEQQQKKEPTATPQPPPPPSSSAITGKPSTRPTSLFNIVSQKKAGVTQTPPKDTGSKTCRKVKFDDSFDSEDSQASLPKKQAIQGAGPDKTNDSPVTQQDDDMPESDTTEVTEDDSEFEVTLRRPRADGTRKVIIRPETCDDDDLSLSAFVPASVRRQSILPSPKGAGKGGQKLDTSIDSVDSFEGVPGAPPDIHKSTVDLVRLGRQHADSSSSLTSHSTNDSSSDVRAPRHRSGYSPDETEESVDERDAIGDLLDEAMDSDAEDQPASSGKPPVPATRKRHSHMMATRHSPVEEGNLPFSISSYRANRNSQIAEVKQTIVRNSQYAGMHIEEEEVEMPTQRQAPVSRHTIQERIRELQELIQQEQNVIMQTSNALNQCCSSNSHFAGSAEQVECNRLLLIACQKRQAYMTEIQRLRDTGCLDNNGPGPQGSLTISDIRLPLKKEFVTKIGTSHDNTTFYFILLLRNGPQLIVTQMLSTHDPMMRGSLDFPNLIKLNGITGSFKLNLDIYCMSVSREPTGKDKKRKTPRKAKTSSMTVQSPGGPMAVRTTSFSHVTSIPLTMKSLDKKCFQLDRLSYLSPLHGTIYMNLKCLMEASVEEKGFLTMFEDVSGLGSWHRRWCVLGGNKLSFWKYPDDEMRKDPMGYIDLKRCVTEKVGLISRDICARPNTFELMTVRQPRKGERDTLVTRTYNTMTTIRHMLSADTKEERIVWCNKLNRALANIRTWNSDALRPISK